MDTINIIFYSTLAGNEPYSDWEDGLGTTTKAIIKTRVNRLRLGQFGDAKRITNGEGVWELRINYGPGYRIYFAKKGSTVVVLLMGGDKGTQMRDIARAKRYWTDYKGLK